MWLLSLLLALPLVSAASPLGVMSGVWNKVLSVGSLSFLGVSGLVPFTRILIWVLTFALFFSVMSFLGAGAAGERRTLGFLKRNHAMVIAAVLATISAIFLPVAAILAVGVGWATAVGLLLIGAPIVGLWYVLWSIPGKDQPDTKGTVLLKLLISLLLFWILSAMNNEVRIVGPTPNATVTGTMANFVAWALYIASIMIIYYIIKFFLVSPPGEAEQKEKEWREGGKALRGWLGKKFADQKARDEIARRAEGVREPKSYFINAVDACEGLITALYRNARTLGERKEAVAKAEKHLKLLKKNLKRAVRSLRYLRRKEKGSVYEVFDNLYSHAGVALQRARSITLPKPDSENWERELSAIHGVVAGHQGIRGVCGAIIKALDAFVEHQQAELLKIEAAQRLEQQVQERAQQQERRQGAAQQRVQEQAGAGVQEQPASRRGLASKPVGAVRRRK